MMMYCGEIPTSVTVSAKPAEREGVIFVSLSIEFQGSWLSHEC